MFQWKPTKQAKKKYYANILLYPNKMNFDHNKYYYN